MPTVRSHAPSAAYGWNTGKSKASGSSLKAALAGKEKKSSSNAAKPKVGPGELAEEPPVPPPAAAGELPSRTQQVRPGDHLGLLGGGARQPQEDGADFQPREPLEPRSLLGGPASRAPLSPPSEPGSVARSNSTWAALARPPSEADSVEHRSPKKHSLRSPAPPSETTETTAAPDSTMSPPSARCIGREFGWEPSKDMDPLDEIPSHVGRRGQWQPSEQLGFNSRQDPRDDKFVVPQSKRWRCAGSSVYEAGAPQRDAAESSEKRAFDEGLRAASHEPPPPMRAAFTDRSARLAEDRRRTWLLCRKEPPVEGPEQPRDREKQTGRGLPFAAPAGATSGTSARGELGHRLHSREDGAFGRRSPSPHTARRDSGMASKLIHNAGAERSGCFRDDREFTRSLAPKSRGRYSPTSPRGVSPRSVLAEGAAGCFTPTAERCIARRGRSCSPVRGNDAVQLSWVKDDPAPPFTPQKKAVPRTEPTAEVQRMQVRTNWQQRYCEAPTDQPRRRAGDCSPRPISPNPVTHAGAEPCYKAAIARVHAKSRVQETMDHQGNERRLAAERDRRLGHEGEFADLCWHIKEGRLGQRQAVSKIRCNHWASSSMAAVLSRD